MRGLFRLVFQCNLLISKKNAARTIVLATFFNKYEFQFLIGIKKR